MSKANAFEELRSSHLSSLATFKLLQVILADATITFPMGRSRDGDQKGFASAVVLAAIRYFLFLHEMMHARRAPGPVPALHVPAPKFRHPCQTT